MKKICFYLLAPFLFTGCDSKDEIPSKNQTLNNPTQTYIINGDIVYEAEITDGSKPKEPIFIYDIPEKTVNNKSTNKSSDGTFIFDFSYGIAPNTNSGCTVDIYSNSSGTYYPNRGVYGYNPYPYNEATNEHLIRGYGKPHHNYYYNCLILQASNKELKRTDEKGTTRSIDDLKASAMSIEYPFSKNKTYEITIRTTFYDNRYLTEKTHSSAFPILHIQLKDDGIITLPNLRETREDACEGTSLNDIGRYSGIGLYSNDNYTRTYSPNTIAATTKDISFYFSPMDNKNALLISLHPAGRGANTGVIPKNNYTMVLPLIKITEKPFDPSINFEIKTNEGGGGRR
ncbi:hypothetical protein K6T82_07120 [Flavobacterium sp. 17A]|uniref:Uncharacterized protein n=1 Tax=Flavobacterium potami TaxID=2872310 RepID=A0A9X1H997_9FLAO|nr:hypothetical protein [Flavobacterium potami]MBZ4034531.1 hypothetical protein [Flavobacterium potami]